MVYGTCIGVANKWFPDHRGLAAGATAGAYGIGTAITVVPIQAMIEGPGYQQAFIVFGIIQGLVVLAAGFFVRAPHEGWAPLGWNEQEAERRRSTYSGQNLGPGQAVRQPSFWLLYFMMTLMGFTGLVVTAQLEPIAEHYGVADVVVAFGMQAITLAILIDRILNGLTRPFWGWVSDHIGRENTMGIAFGLQAITIVGWLSLIDHPIMFVVLSGFAYFSWGEIYSLFPATVGDMYGPKWATTNYGIMYTSKGLASIFAGPVAALASVESGSWVPILWIMAVCAAIDSALAWVVLKPLVRRNIQRLRSENEDLTKQIPPGHKAGM